MSIPSVTNPVAHAGTAGNAADVVTSPRPPHTTQPKDNPPSHADVVKAVQAVNDFVGTINDNLQFSVDHDTGKTIVKVVDSTTKEVIKQIPSEEMVAIAKAMDKLKGLLIQQKA